MPVGVTVPTQYPAELGGSELEADVGCSQSRARWGTRWGVPPWHSQRYPPRPAVPIHSLPSARRWAQGWWRLCILLPVPIVALGTHSAIASLCLCEQIMAFPGADTARIIWKARKKPNKTQLRAPGMPFSEGRAGGWWPMGVMAVQGWGWSTAMSHRQAGGRARGTACTTPSSSSAKPEHSEP